MVTVAYDSSFEKTLRKLKNEAFKQQVKKQIQKIIENPQIGKPMRYARKGTREVYVSPFRLSYAYLKNEDTLVFLAL